MPEALQYITRQTGDAYKALEGAFADEMKARQAMIARAWAYYNGDHDRQLEPQKDGYNDNVVVNHVETLADKTASFLLGDGVAFDAGGDDEGGDTDTAIAQMWKANRGDLLMSNIALSGAVEGHCAVRLVPPTDDTGRIIEGYPRIIRIQQRHFAAFWDAMDMERVLWFRLQHQAGGMGRRIDYVRGRLDGEGATAQVDHNVPGWVEIVYQTKMNQTQTLLGPDATEWEWVSATPWERDWPPIVAWQNTPNPNGYYGRNDVKSAIELNDSINFILSNLKRIIKHYAHPKTIGTGFSVEELIETPVGGFWAINTADANVFNLEMQNDGELSKWMAATLTQSLWQSGGMVDPQTIKDKVGQLTNFALLVLYIDAIRKTGKKRMLYDEGFDLINRHGLELAGITPPDEIVTVWPDVLPEDAATEAETLLKELEASIISKETYRERRGYSHEREMDRLQDEAETNTNPLAGLLAGQGFDTRAFNGG